MEPGAAIDWVRPSPPPPAEALRAAVRAAYRLEENAAVARILAAAELPPAMRTGIAVAARRLVA